MAPAVREQDSVPMMSTYGLNMLISDSGVIKYRIVSERCLINQNVNPKRTIFDKGVFLTQFDEKFHVQDSSVVVRDYSGARGDMSIIQINTLIWKHRNVHLKVIISAVTRICVSITSLIRRDRLKRLI